jgi:hypothetical protein
LLRRRLHLLSCVFFWDHRMAKPLMALPRLDSR